MTRTSGETSRTPRPPSVPRATTDVARRAVSAVFIVNGIAFATWASRLPAIRDDLGLSPGRLGIVLLAISAGSVSMLPLAGAVVRRLGPARAVLVSAGVAESGLVVAGLAGEVWALAIGLGLIGMGVGVWDVAMNVEAADVERRLERDIMPRFHAGFSIGTVIGAGGGALAAGVGLPVAVHLPIVGVVVFAAIVVSVRTFLPWSPEVADAAVPGAPGPRGDGVWRAWLERPTLLIGLLVFSMALAEGSANDWLAIALVDGYGATHSLAAIGFGVFVTAMTAVRMAGPWILARVDRVVVLRASALLVLLGTALVVGGAADAGGHGGGLDLVIATAGALAWGAGSALGFPLGMTAAASDPERSAARVSVVSTIGYTAFLAGPPLLGALGQHVGVARSLVGVSVAVLLALLTAGAVRR